MTDTDNVLLDHLGLTHPIIQGPFGGGLSTVELVTTVSNSGGLGSYGAHYLEPDGLEARLSALNAATNKPFAVNLWVSDHDPEARDFSQEAYDAAWRVFAPLYAEYELEKPERPQKYHPRFDEQIEVLLESAPQIFSFVFGIPDKRILDACRARNIITIGAATTLQEARALEDADIDYILATGFEAGGHRVSFLKPAEESLMGTLALTRLVAAQTSKPVIAAGGIVDADSAAAALRAGASAVQIGTAFLACQESGTTDMHRAALFSNRAEQTQLTRAYTGRLARGIPNRLIQHMEHHTEHHKGRLPPFPVQAWFVAPLRAASIAAGEDDFLSLYANQAAPLLKHRSAADLITDLISHLD